MKIDAMRKREDFYSINEKTLEDYYNKVFAYDLKISTCNASVFKHVFVYPKINAIVTRFPSRKVLKYIFAEFNVRNNILKFIAGKLYTALCLFSGGLIASKTLKFFNFCPMHKNSLILPCNRKIRIFDFENSIVDSIVKEGFTMKYFNNELSFRLRSTYSFVPVIIIYGENWYREPLLPGQPLARIADDIQYKVSCNYAIAHIKKIADDTLEYENSIKYAKELYEKIESLISEAKEKKKIATGDILLKTAKKAFDKARLLQNGVPIVLSHGDLQAGNIWVDTLNNRTYIIDWETYAKRSIWYDAATLLIAMRRHNGVINMVSNCKSEAVKNAVLINDSKKDYNMESVMGILILEDIIFYLEDNLELSLDWGRDLIDNYGRQLINIK